MTSLEGPWHVLVKRALAVSAPIISTSICYIGQFRTLIFQRPLRDSNAYARRAKFVPGACPTSQSAKWKTYSVFHKGIAARQRDPTLASIGSARGCSAAAVALAWTIRSGKVIAIPESGSPAHVKENAVALALTLTPQELQTLDAAHPRR
jgi:hypothetical protein